MYFTFILQKKFLRTFFSVNVVQSCKPLLQTKVKPFINKYNWKGINFPTENDDWRKFKKNNLTIALNVRYAKK